MVLQQITKSSTTDTAALSASIVAAIVSMYLSSGPYDIFGGVISFSLLMFVMGYVWPYQRTSLQSNAIAASVGIIVLPLFGVLIEIIKSDDVAWFLLPQAEREAISSFSRVRPLEHLGMWLFVYVFCYWSDFVYQGRFSRKGVQSRGRDMD